MSTHPTPVHWDLAFSFSLFGCHRFRWDPLIERPVSLDLLAEIGWRGRGAVRLNGALTARNWVDRRLCRDAVLALSVCGELVMPRGARGRMSLKSSATPDVSIELASAASAGRLAPHWLTWSGHLLQDGEPLAELRLRYDAKRDLPRTLRSLRLTCHRPRTP